MTPTQKLLFLDTETTGNDPSKDRLCQVCYQTAEGIFTEFFKPPVPISIKSMSITHITNEMVADKPAFDGSPLQQQLQALLQDHILVAHNALFDVGMLKAEGMVVPKFICTLRVARFLDPQDLVPEYNLQYLRYFFNLQVPDVNAHDATGDVLVQAALWRHLFNQHLAATKKSPDEIITELIQVSSRPSLIRKFTFGKYKDKLIADVGRKDPGYLEWLLREKQQEKTAQGPLNANNDDWIYSLNYHLGRKT